MTEWIVIGGGPSAERYWASAGGIMPVPRTNKSIITCNNGLSLCHPEHYLLTDDWAIEQYMDDALEAQRRGTRIISHECRREDVPQANEYLDYEFANVTNYNPGRIAHARSSGVICVQYAIMHGATKIHLLGFDGFPPDAMKYGRMDENGVEIQRDRYGMNECMSCVLGRIISIHEDIEFVWWGGAESLLCFPDWRVTVK